MDTFLNDLQQWKDKRDDNQASDLSDNDTKKIKDVKEEYECVDALYMKQALEREEALLD